MPFAPGRKRSRSDGRPVCPAPAAPAGQLLETTGDQDPDREGGAQSCGAHGRPQQLRKLEAGLLQSLGVSLKGTVSSMPEGAAQPTAPRASATHLRRRRAAASEQSPQPWSVHPPEPRARRRQMPRPRRRWRPPPSVCSAVAGGRGRGVSQPPGTRSATCSTQRAAWIRPPCDSSRAPTPTGRCAARVRVDGLVEQQRPVLGREIVIGRGDVMPAQAAPVWGGIARGSHTPTTRDRERPADAVSPRLALVIPYLNRSFFRVASRVVEIWYRLERVLRCFLAVGASTLGHGTSCAWT